MTELATCFPICNVWGINSFLLLSVYSRNLADVFTRKTPMPDRGPNVVLVNRLKDYWSTI